MEVSEIDRKPVDLEFAMTTPTARMSTLLLHHFNAPLAERQKGREALVNKATEALLRWCSDPEYYGDLPAPAPFRCQECGTPVPTGTPVRAHALTPWDADEGSQSCLECEAAWRAGVVIEDTKAPEGETFDPEYCGDWLLALKPLQEVEVGEVNSRLSALRWAERESAHWEDEREPPPEETQMLIDAAAVTAQGLADPPELSPTRRRELWMQVLGLFINPRTCRSPALDWLLEYVPPPDGL
jgi:hypothetical protein